jgi:hypothetical protein
LKKPKGSIMTFMAVFMIGTIKSSIFGFLFGLSSMVMLFLSHENVISLRPIKTSFKAKPNLGQRAVSVKEKGLVK